MSFNPFMHNVVKWPNILQKGLLLLILEKNPDVLQGPRRVSDYCKKKITISRNIIYIRNVNL